MKEMPLSSASGSGTSRRVVRSKVPIPRVSVVFGRALGGDVILFGGVCEGVGWHSRRFNCLGAPFTSLYRRALVSGMKRSCDSYLEFIQIGF